MFFNLNFSKMKHYTLIKGVCILALGCCLSGCGKDNDKDKDDEAKKLTSINVDPASLSLLTGEKKSITATPEPADVEATFTWTSSDVTKATVSPTGEVTGVAEGTATITVSSGAVNAIVSVEVSDVYLTGIDVEATALTLFIYDEAQLDAKPVPANAVDGDIFYRTSDAEVATVNANGKVLALKAGTATIEAYHLNIKKAVEVTVEDFSNIDDWRVNASSCEGGAWDEYGVCSPDTWWAQPRAVLTLQWGNETYWHTVSAGGTMPQWLTVDMRTRKKLTGFQYQNAKDGAAARPQAFTISVSDDGSNWTTVLEAEDFPFINTMQTLVFADMEGFVETHGAPFLWARYYKINITAVHGDYGYTYVAYLRPIEPEPPATGE
jgi:hypothetical protein